MPGYWFLYNMYALARNAWKYKDRDKRIEKIQLLEYDYLAPDSIQEMCEGVDILAKAAGMSFLAQDGNPEGYVFTHPAELGTALLKNQDPRLEGIEILVQGWENSKRPIQLLKVQQAWNTFHLLLGFYTVSTVSEVLDRDRSPDWSELYALIPKESISWGWKNVGGQLMPSGVLSQLISKIKDGSLTDWDQIHGHYSKLATDYPVWKAQHAFQCLLSAKGISKEMLDQDQWDKLVTEAGQTRKWLSDQVFVSRKKDYVNPFRNMVYESGEERDLVLGALEDNSFIQQERKECELYIARLERLKFGKKKLKS
jgi:hypothetical protein